MGSWEWEDHLTLVLSTKRTEVVQEVYQFLQKHNCSVKKLKSELYYRTQLFDKLCSKYCIMPM